MTDNKADQELRAARDLIARLESEVGQYQALEAGLRRRVEAAYYGLRYNRMTTLEVLDELYAALAATETKVQPPGALIIEDGAVRAEAEAVE